MNLKKLPQEEKPRERLLKYGKNNVSNNELIEIILKSGTKRAGIKGFICNETVLEQSGSDESGDSYYRRGDGRCVSGDGEGTVQRRIYCPDVRLYGGPFRPAHQTAAPAVRRHVFPYAGRRGGTHGL